MPTKLAEANQLLCRIAYDSRQPAAARRRAQVALNIANGSGSPEAQHRRASAPVAARQQPSAADILADTRQVLAQLPDGARGLSVLAQHDPTLMASLDSEIPYHLREQLNSGAESQYNEARQREFLARRFGT